MKRNVQQYLSVVVLLIWGGVLGYFVLSGRIGDYLHPAFHIWTTLSAVVLLLMAVGLLVLPEKAESCCGHDHEASGGVGWLPSIILTVPFVAAVVISPSQFGAAMVSNRGIVDTIASLPGYQPYRDPVLPTEDGSVGPTQTEPSSDYLPRNATGQIVAQTVDLLYAAEEPTMRQDFEGEEIELIGQFMPAREKNAAGDRFSLVRMYVMCCAADARPVGVSVQTDQLDQFTEMSWVKVIGKTIFPVEGGKRIPVVVAQKIEVCDPPEETFIY